MSMDECFFESLNKDSVVLTANRRLAAYLHQQYAKYQKKLVWETPQILPLSTWLKTVWLKNNKSHILLNTLQEQALWKKVSQQNWEALSMIQQAWETLNTWDIDLNAIQSSESISTEHFYQWACNFKNENMKNAWITNSEIPKQLLELTNLEEQLPSFIFFLGFDELSPIIKKLLKKIETFCTVTHIELPASKSEIRRIELENQEYELRQMADWALQENLRNPQKKIACVIPNLTQIRREVVRVFSGVFPERSIFNISAGQHLNEFLIIQTALFAIQEQWENLLQLPYLTLSEEDRDFAAFVDKKRRAENLSHFDTQDLLPLFTELHARFPGSTYLKRWNQLMQYKKNIPALQTLDQWMHTFTEFLKILQWPGTRTLNSTEHQILQRWLKALEELTQCSTLFSEINRDTAFALLNHHIKQIIFQPKSDQSPVQVLGVLETAGLPFDAMWIMGLDNECWPPTASPNPFLPYALQIQHNMPHASADRELQFAQKTMARLFASTADITLSSSKKDGDRELSPSQLISEFNITESKSTDILNLDYWIPQSSLGMAMLETILDNTGTPLTESKNTKGGTSVLKYQSICPFKAYATFRLDAEALETPALGLSPKLRGQLLHQVLELIWKRIKSQANLLALNSTQLDTIIALAIENSTESLTFKKSENHFLNIEKKRLLKIINNWLDIEKERSPFTVIAHESSREMIVGPLSFRGRIDRIDQLNNGAEIIIDYKSGYSSIYDWFGERPADPQLPTYCLFSSEKAYTGIAFAEVRSGTMQLKGVISDQFSETQDVGISSINNLNNSENITDWNALTQYWKPILENLSYAFSQGQAEIDPLESACDYCELQPLCRVNECPL